MRLGRALAFASIVSLSFVAGSTHAGAPGGADTAEAIVRRALGRDVLGLSGGHATISITITAEDGTQEKKSLELWAAKEDGLLRTKLVFKKPAKIAGVAFLLLQQRGQLDEQYVYLPAYKKARRVTLAERDGSFAGSDFTYADLEHHDFDDATYARLADEKLGADACHVVEARPTAAAKSAYSRVKLWLRAGDDVAMKTEFYDVAGKLSKTLLTKKVGVVDGRTIVTESRMERAGSRRATDLVVDEVQFPKSLPAQTFSRTRFEAGG